MPMDVAIPLVARLCLVGMFPFSAIEKVVWWRNARAQAKSGLVSGGPVMLVLAIIVEAVTPVLIVAGLFDRAAALLLAGFCAVTAVLYHPFWTFPDFWSPRADSTAREHFWQFMKNFGLIGGLLLVAFAGPAAVSPAAILSHPFTSTGVYHPAQAR